MAHLLIVELPGRIDTDLVDAARARGDTFVFLTMQPERYEAYCAAREALAHAEKVVTVASFAPGPIDEAVLAEHRHRPFDALLCLLHIRVAEAARLARLIGARFLNPESAALLMDKHAVRLRLAERGLAQPAFAQADRAGDLVRTVRQVGLPAVVKPCDGYGSQRIVALDDPDCYNLYLPHLELALRAPLDYGFGVESSGRLLVERRLQGRLLGCDTLSIDGDHRLLGIHEKALFPGSWFAIRGGSFTPGCAGMEAVRDYVFAALDAVGFDCGAAHVELFLTDTGPQLVELNPRMVGSTIPRLVSLATGRSMHADVIALHLGEHVPEPEPEAARVAVTRWVAAPRDGTLAALELTHRADPRVQGIEVFARAGDRVRRPYENSDRLACVMACSASRTEAEAAAEAVVAGARVLMESDA